MAKLRAEPQPQRPPNHPIPPPNPMLPFTIELFERFSKGVAEEGLG
jgi:hypothetical protein